MHTSCIGIEPNHFFFDDLDDFSYVGSPAIAFHTVHTQRILKMFTNMKPSYKYLLPGG